MSDDSFATLRTQRARVALDVWTSLWFVLMVPAWTLCGSLVGILAVVAGAVAWWLLKLSVRDVADLPDRFLDERQLAVRNQVYVEGPPLVRRRDRDPRVGRTGRVHCPWRRPDTGTVDLTYEWFTGLFWTVMASALALPSMVLAVCDREHVLSTSA